MSQLDYGIIGNCQISALVHRDGTIAWCCMPRFDSPAVFASLLDAKIGGSWSIEPSSGQDGAETRQHYMRNTNILVTTYVGPGSAQFEIIDFAPRFETAHGYHKPTEIVRIVRPVRGTPRIIVRVRPRFGYGKDEPRSLNLSSGIVYEGNGERLHLRTDAPLDYLLNESAFDLHESKHFVLSYGAPFPGHLKFDVEEQLDRTASYWRGWTKHCSIPFEFQDQVIRSALTLKLHIYEDTGAIIAATTTSVPEGPEPGRTWDYRYCWLRDAYFVVTALNRLGQFEEMESFIRYLQNICASEPSRILQPVYGVAGEKELVERELPWLSGFNHLGPVRIGNAAYKMDQHDVYGEMVLAIAPTFFDRRLDRTDLTLALQNVEQLVGQAIRSFEKPDAGIWEFRKEKQHSVFSKLMNWAAVDRGVRIAGQVGRKDLVDQWVPIRDEMRAGIEREGWNEFVGYYAQSYRGDSPDAANLLIPSLNFATYDDDKVIRTIDAYERRLRVGRGVFRYRTPDDFGLPKTTFTVCAFWLADALWGIGRRNEARELFSAVINKANHVGILSEDMDPESGELWGNFPQTYSHVGLINTAWRVSRSWEDAF